MHCVPYVDAVSSVSRVCLPRCAPSLVPPNTASLKRLQASSAGQQPRRKRIKKSTTITTFAAAAEPSDLTADQVINERIDKASSILNDMMDEIHQNLFVSGAVAEVLGKPPDVSEAEAIAAAVASCIEQLDEAFLLALGAYCNAAQQQGNSALAGRLSRIHQQVLSEISQRLPPEMQVLDKMLSMLSREERKTLLRKAVQGGDPRLGVPGCDLRRVQGAAVQMISDMEEKEAIPDRRLLARLCIAKEEIAQMAAERQWDQYGVTEEVDDNNVATHTQAVPKGAVAFLKELLMVSQPAVRVSFLQKAFREEFDPTTKQRSSRQVSTPEAIRPGSFLSCVSATQKQMQSMKGSDATLKKLEDIWREALQVLESIAE